MRATIDANVFVAGFVRERNSTSPPALIVRRWLFDAFEVVISDHLETEIHEALAKPYFRSRMSLETIDDVKSVIANFAFFVKLTGDVSGVAGNANILVTGDQELLALGTFEGVAILTASDFLALLDRNADSVTAAMR